jgi:branched-chain amino acid transport system permease protein
MEYYYDIGVQIMFYVMLGASLNLLLGYAGEMSMATASFFGVGAYTAGLLSLLVATGAVAAVSSRGVAGGAGWALWPAVLVAIVGAFVVAMVIALPAISRVRGEYLILLTLAFQVVVNQLMSSAVSVTGGPYGLTPIPALQLPWGEPLLEVGKIFWPLLVLTGVIVAICYGLGESPFGRLLKGIREQEVAVRAVGKNTIRPKVLVFGFAAGVAGLAGALHASYYQFIAPGTYNLDLSILIIAIVILGGIGNLTGTVIAAVILGSLKPILEKVVGDNAISWQAVIYGLALVVLIRIRPQGLLPEGTGLRALARFLRRGGRGVGMPPGAELALAGAGAGDPRSDGVPANAPASAASAVEAAVVAEPRALPASLEADDQPAGAEGDTVLKVSALSKRFGGLQAVDTVGFELPRGQVTALIGPNGAGKTTIFNLITNTIKPDSGTVILNGRDVTGMSPHRIAQAGMARSFQDGRLFERLTARDNVAMAVPGQNGESLAQLGLRPVKSLRTERHVRQVAEDALAFVGLQDAGDRIVGDMAFGEQKLVAIARLLATDCDVLLLDEPTSGVDPHAVEHVIGVVRGLRNTGKTVCLVEHSVYMVGQLADHGIFMDQGKVVTEGSIDELMGQERLAEIYFGA